MRLTKAEKIILVLTLVFVVFALGWHFTMGRTADMTISTAASTPAPLAEGRVNINTASIEELVTLPGLGELVAGEIVAYRDGDGKFRDVEDLRFVPGMNDLLFDMIKDHVCVK